MRAERIPVPFKHFTPSPKTKPVSSDAFERKNVQNVLFGIPSHVNTSVFGFVEPDAIRCAPPSAELEFAHPRPSPPKFEHGHAAVTTESIPSPKQYATPGPQPSSFAMFLRILAVGMDVAKGFPEDDIDMDDEQVFREALGPKIREYDPAALKAGHWT